MKGNNEIHLNIATLTEIIQFYFNTELFQDDVTVKGVQLNRAGYGGDAVIVTVGDKE